MGSRLGLADGVFSAYFAVWAPRAKRVSVVGVIAPYSGFWREFSTAMRQLIGAIWAA